MSTTSLVGPADVHLAGELPDINPIVLVPRADPFDDPESIFEPKYDGMRGLLYASGQGCQVRSHLGFTLDRLRGLCERIGEVLGRREAILDGEVVGLNRRGKPGFPDLIRGLDFVAFAAFDLLWLDGTDLRHLPLRERKRLLAGVLPEDTGPLYKMLTLDEYGRALFAAIKKIDLEGVVAKRKDDSYCPDTVWYKIVNPLYSRSRGLPQRVRALRAASLRGHPS